MMRMIAEPHKIKTVRRIHFHTPEERVKFLLDAGCNTFHIPSDHVWFDMTSQGTAAVSHDQLSGILVGDEAYAGSINFINLQKAVTAVLGHEFVCPTHNVMGSHTLLSTTLVQTGDIIFSNSLAPQEMTRERGGTIQCLRVNPKEEGLFTGNLDIDLLKQTLTAIGCRRAPYIYIEAYANGMYPISLSHLETLRTIAEENAIPLVLNASRVVENAIYIRNHEKKRKYQEEEEEERTIQDLVKQIVSTSHVCIMDAGQDACCNVGGLISTDNPKLHEKFQNEVVVYEGLHTYGGMAGRTMEIFARGLVEMVQESQAMWIHDQVQFFCSMLDRANIPFIPGCDGAYLKANEFLPNATTYPAQTLAAALYLKSCVRAFLQGRHNMYESILPVQIPRLALTNSQLKEIAHAIQELYHNDRQTIDGLELVLPSTSSRLQWHDQAVFEWKFTPAIPPHQLIESEPYTIHTIEHVGVTTRAQREQAIRNAGYNTFLLLSKDVTIDFLTDSGTSAMSVEQWKTYEGGIETPATSSSYYDFVETIRNITGYKHIIPTHQGRAAEHIMSTVMIQQRQGFVPGDMVPGNMYFTTTKLHQELAGGKFVDVIVDEAHDPMSTFEWKGNIDLDKIRKLVHDYGAQSLPYISFEMSVNMAGGQPFSMDNAREVYTYCKEHGIPVMFDSTRAAENAYMIQKKDQQYKDTPIKDILKEMFSYGDGCTVSSKKDCLVNIGGYLAYRDNEELYERSLDMLRKYEGSVTSGGLSAGDLSAHAQGMREMVEDNHLRARVEATQYLGKALLQSGIPIVEPPGTHAIFLDAKRFVPHIPQDEFPAQALAAALFVECGVRAMERGSVSKGRDSSGSNQKPALELVRLTIPRRVYTRSHMDLVAKGIIQLYQKRHTIKGLRFVYEPRQLRFFQSRFQEVSPSFGKEEEEKKHDDE